MPCLANTDLRVLTTNCEVVDLIYMTSGYQIVGSFEREEICGYIPVARDILGGGSE